MEKYYLATLKLVKGLGDRKILRLLEIFQTATRIWQLLPRELEQTKLLTTVGLQHLQQLKKENIPERLREICVRQNIKIITYRETEYPESLRQLCDCPILLYTKGQGNLTATYNLAVVGPREASLYGKQVVEYLLQALSKTTQQVQIISGGARGIDTKAHLGALEYGLPTIAVFGCGLDQAYPPENSRLFEQIQTTGLIVSEYPPGSKASKFTFPARNRIICGLSRGVVLAEAPERSGALITAELAFENGREVYCVPGSIFSKNTVGVHNLIKQGAKLITNIEDILIDFQDDFKVGNRPKNIFSGSDQYQQISLKEATNGLELDEKQKNVYNSLDYQIELSAEDLLCKLQIELSELNLVLLQLEMYGLAVRNEYNKKYLRK